MTKTYFNETFQDKKQALETDSSIYAKFSTLKSNKSKRSGGIKYLANDKEVKFVSYALGHDIQDNYFHGFGLNKTQAITLLVENIKNEKIKELIYQAIKNHPDYKEKFNALFDELYIIFESYISSKNAPALANRLPDAAEKRMVELNQAVDDLMVHYLARFDCRKDTEYYILQAVALASKTKVIIYEDAENSSSELVAKKVWLDSNDEADALIVLYQHYNSAQEFCFEILLSEEADIEEHEKLKIQEEFFLLCEAKENFAREMSSSVDVIAHGEKSNSVEKESDDILADILKTSEETIIFSQEIGDTDRPDGEHVEGDDFGVEKSSTLIAVEKTVRFYFDEWYGFSHEISGKEYQDTVIAFESGKISSLHLVIMITHRARFVAALNALREINFTAHDIEKLLCPDNTERNLLIEIIRRQDTIAVPELLHFLQEQITSSNKNNSAIWRLFQSALSSNNNLFFEMTRLTNGTLLLNSTLYIKEILNKILPWLLSEDKLDENTKKIIETKLLQHEHHSSNSSLIMKMLDLNNLKSLRAYLSWLNYFLSNRVISVYAVWDAIIKLDKNILIAIFESMNERELGLQNSMLVNVFLEALSKEIILQLDKAALAELEELVIPEQDPLIVVSAAFKTEQSSAPRYFFDWLLTLIQTDKISEDRVNRFLDPLLIENIIKMAIAEGSRGACIACFDFLVELAKIPLFREKVSNLFIPSLEEISPRTVFRAIAHGKKDDKVLQHYFQCIVTLYQEKLIPIENIKAFAFVNEDETIVSDILKTEQAHYLPIILSFFVDMTNVNGLTKSDLDRVVVPEHHKHSIFIAICKLNSNKLLNVYLQWLLTNVEVDRVVALLCPSQDVNPLIEVLKTGNLSCVQIFLDFVRNLYEIKSIGIEAIRTLFAKADITGESPYKISRKIYDNRGINIAGSLYQLLNGATKEIYGFGLISDVHERSIDSTQVADNVFNVTASGDTGRKKRKFTMFESDEHEANSPARQKKYTNAQSSEKGSSSSGCCSKIAAQRMFRSAIQAPPSSSSGLRSNDFVMHRKRSGSRNP